jgi:DHA1 family multidrug resistance protein-like MFS transporter
VQAVEEQQSGLWKRNLPVVWLAIFFGIFSFSFIFPFIPLYIKDLGIDDSARAALWSGLVGGAGGLGMFIGAPVWGMIGDRYGRKKNMVRALLGTGIMLALTGLSTNVYQLLAFRLVGGFMSGIPPTAMALIASQSPRSKTSFCIGMLQMAIFLGSTFGPLAGGYLTSWLGFQRAFFAGGTLLVVMGFVVAAVIREDFKRPRELETAGPFAQLKLFFEAVTAKQVLVVLVILFMLQFAPTIMNPVLPLFLAELGGEASSSISSGFAFSVMGFTSAISSLLMPRLAARIGLKSLIVVFAALSGFCYMPMLVVNATYQAIALVAVFGLLSGAMLGSTSALLSLAVPREQQGRAFGASQSAVACAFALGPIVGGAFGSGLGLRSVFLVSAVGFLLVALVSTRLIRLQNDRAQREDRAGPPTAR